MLWVTENMNGQGPHQARTMRRMAGATPRPHLGAMILIIAAAVTVTGCLTASDPLSFDAAPLFGMIYDSDNQPLSGETASPVGRPATGGRDGAAGG